MPIRGLDKIITYNSINCYSKMPVSLLKETILCIDGFWFLKKYASINILQDFFIDKDNIKFIKPILSLIKIANANNFSVLWVWDGLDYKKPTIDIELDKITNLKNGYDSFKREDIKMSNQHLKNLFDYEFQISQINNLLKQFNFRYVRAPYSATAQIAYYLKNDICTYAFCKTDATLFEGVDKIITDFDLDNNSISIFSTLDFFKIFELDYFSYKTLSFALGCEFCPTLPDYAKNFIFENILTTIKTGNLDSYLQNKENKLYSELFFNAFNLVDFHPIMTENGTINFYNGSNIIPHDFEKLFGQRLPDKIYSKFFVCKLSKGILEDFFKDKKCNSLNKISMGILNSKFNLFSDYENINIDMDLESIFTKNFIKTENLEVIQQVLIYYLITEDILTAPYKLKLASLINPQDKVITNKEKVDIIFDYDLLEFVYKAQNLIKNLREVVECYEFVTDKETNFKPDIFCFIYGSLYYNANNYKKNNSSVICINNFIKNVSKFCHLNRNTSILFEHFSRVINEES